MEALAKRYDDGGISGGIMERPAFMSASEMFARFYVADGETYRFISSRA